MNANGIGIYELPPWAPPSVRDAHEMLSSERLSMKDEKQVELAARLRRFIAAQEKAEQAEAEDDACCEACDGTGMHVCDCGHKHACHECDGTGEGPSE